MLKILILGSILCMTTACTRAPLKALEAVVDAATEVTNSAIDEHFASDHLYELAALEAPPPSSIPLTIQLASPLNPDITNLEVYLLHTQIKQMIDKKSFDANSTLTFSPNSIYYVGTYYGDTLAIKYNYQDKLQTIKIALAPAENHITLDFVDQKFQVIESKYIPPDKNQFITQNF